MAQQPPNLPLPGGPGVQQQPQNINLFPPPPIYAEQYSSDNVKKGLVLPPPPLPTKFEVFTEPYDLEGPLLPTLSDLGCQQLYSGSGNWRAELKKLNRSLVAAFLDLIEILVRCPDHVDRLEKIDTIRNLFINIHHLINEYRPVQARDTLRQMVSWQNQEIVNVTEQLNKLTEMGSAALETLTQELSKFTFDDTIPSMSSCWSSIDNEKLNEAADYSGSSTLQLEQAEENLITGSIQPVELPTRVLRKENPTIRLHIQKEFSKQSTSK